jgi:hypothetical protein
MKFGVREICDVVLKAKANQKIGNKLFYRNEPVLYFDTLKTSSMEGAATTVYAQGGKGNARLLAWEGERTLTFTMEDALISPAGFAILSGAGLINASEDASIKVHTTQEKSVGKDAEITLDKVPYVGTTKENNTGEDWIYVMKLDHNGNPETEPYIYTLKDSSTTTIVPATSATRTNYDTKATVGYEVTTALAEGDRVLVDYYYEEKSHGMQIDITPDKFGGYYYLEASTLFRDQDGTDLPAEFIIPKCKIQSNFTFTMASSGDPSTFTFTIDAFPDYTRFSDEKVLAQIQVITASGNNNNLIRESTEGADTHEYNEVFNIIEDPDKSQQPAED